MSNSKFQGASFDTPKIYCIGETGKLYPYR